MTDHACREIRHKRITRDQGIQLVNYYQHNKFKHENLIYEWLGISQNSANFVMNKHRNPKYWEEYLPKKWRYRKLKNFDFDETCEFIDQKLRYKNSTYYNTRHSGYITVGKGYP